MTLIGSEPPTVGRPQLAAGLEAQKAGDLDGAEKIYRAALALEPDNADALHLLAIVASQRGQVQEAIGLFRRAIALNDRAASFHGNLANALHRAGMTEAAIAEYRRAIELDPGYSSAYSNLGNALRALRRRDEAVASYRRGCELNPRSPEGWNNLGIGLTETGKVEEAIACFKRALELRPRYREAYNNLGNAWHEAGDTEQAIECFHRALEITPDDPGAQNNLAVVLQGLGRMDESIERYRRALASQSDYPEAHNNLGSAMFDLTRLDEAIACYRRALALRPDYAEAEANCSHALLMKGDLEGGWPLYERRWEGSKDARGARRKIACPQWYGGPIQGKRILLHTEQGYGDALQFVRYVPLVAARGASVVLECPARMKRLFASVEGVWQLVARGETVPTVDLHCPLLSLPLAFSTTLATIPARVPYLFPDAGLLKEWGERVPRDGVLRVGLAWRGEPRNRNDYRRSLPLDALAPLAGIGNVRFYSLQVGVGQAEAAAPPAGMQIVDLTGEITDFADTAALLAQLDLIVSVDTAVAHLAGAIGRPVWLLNRFESEWRWLLEREDSPWYPTMRIFRQARARDWTTVVDRVAKELAQAAREGKVGGGVALAAVPAPRVTLPVTRNTPRRVTEPAIGEALRRGISLQRAGNAAGARRIYEEVLAREPDCADAVHLLAIVQVESGQTGEGIASFRRAIAIDGRVAAYYGNLGDALARAGRLDEAIAECRRGLEVDPGSGAAYSSLGNALREKGALRQAIASYRQACRLKPGSVEAWNNLGVALTGVGEFEEAVSCLKQSLGLYPDGRDALHNLANAHQRAGAPVEAARCYARLLELDPRDARARDGMGIVLQDQGRIEEAIAQFNQALALKPDYADAHNHLGGAYAELTRVEEAIASYRRALELQPGNASAEWNCSLALLSRGEYAEGWRLYERRWDSVKGTPSARRAISRPQWEGESIAGKTILLHAEQGLGDTLQFARYVPMVAARGARVVLECQPQLKRLLAGLAGVAELVARGEPVPDCDVHSPLLSLPRIFGTDLATVPADIPYLAADEVRIERWQPRMPGDAGLRVGLAWRGEPKNPTDRKRSVPLAAFAPLAQVRDAHFFSLQLGAGAEEAADPPPGLNLIDPTGEIADFADTAALMAHLDLVISVDTAVVHLAGALGRPVWLLNRFESEWRWMLEREDSPWYPSLRILRQPRAGDWATVIERVAALLAGIAQGRRPVVPASRMLPARDAYVAGDLAAARSLLGDLVSRYPDAADAHTNLGSVLHSAGEKQQAVNEYLRALALDPKAADALNNLGGALRDQGRTEAAIRCYGRAASLKPDYGDAWNNLGLALAAGGRPEAAIPCFERASALDAALPGALVNLGKALRDAGMGERAADCFRQVLAAHPEDAEAHNNLANVLQEQGALEESLALYRRALELRPDFPGARENCAYALLLAGSLVEGWEMYEWRADGARSAAGIKRFIPLPLWDGGDPAERTLLLTTEQGLGDEIMFASMLPELHAMGARVIVECTGKLGALFARSFPWARVLVAERTPEAWEKRLAQLAGAAAGADAQCALGSLARFLRATPGRFPRHAGYLAANCERVAYWRERLAALGSGLKVGLSWRGGPPGFAQRRRSIDLAALEPLFQVPGVRFVSLQYTDCREEIDAFSESTGHVVSHWQEAIDDYDETAALVVALDMVVSVCTAVVHLAGALGKPVRVMVPSVPEWRYRFEGSDMAWYPSVRLHRQRVPGQWSPVIEEVAAVLTESGAREAVQPSLPAPASVAQRARPQPDTWRNLFPDSAEMRVGLLLAVDGGNAAFRAPLLRATAKLAAVDGVRMYGLSGYREGEQDEERGLPVVDLQDYAADPEAIVEVIGSLDVLITTDADAAQRADALGKPAWLVSASAGKGRSDEPVWLGGGTRVFSGRAGERPEALVQRVIAAVKVAATGRTPAVKAESMRAVQAQLQAGSLPSAEKMLRNLVRLQPGAADAHGNLGIVLQGAGRGADARTEYLRALSLNPRFADALNNLGTAFQDAGDAAAALRCYRRAVQLRPEHGDAWANLGLALCAGGQTDAAIAAYERALKIAPGSRGALNGLGKALRDARQHERAEASFRQALALDPGHADTQNNLAAVLAEQGRFDEAIALYRRALAARPAYPEALKNLGSAFLELTRLDEAIDCYRQSLRLRPEYAEAQWDCSHALLMRGKQGDWAAGWKLYESRWDAAEGLRGRKRLFGFPQWNGEAIAGRSILIYTEQGLGDAIQFVRYLPLLAARGANVVLECQAPLARLFAGVTGIARLVVRGDAIPVCDFQSPLLSLPLVFGTDTNSVPASIPYLGPPPESVRDKAALVSADGRLRVGLVWRGGPNNPRDARRSMALEVLRRLADVPGVRFYSLQVGGDTTREIAAVPDLSLTDLSGAIEDFADTAAVVAQLDLVIAVDTAVAHLAGALGKPVWMLCRFESEWRWMLERADSPWYPSMRIFRQPGRGDWGGVIARVKAQLFDLARAGGRGKSAVQPAAAAPATPAVPGFDSTRPEAWNARGAALARSGDAAGAVGCFERALALRPDYREALSNLGNALNRAGEVERAIECLERALALRPEEPGALNNLGIVLQGQGRAKEAIEFYRRALAARPVYPEALNNLGSVLLLDARPEEAIAALREALGLRPAYPEALNNLGSALFEQGKVEEAIARYRQALALRPDYPEVLGNLGSALALKCDLPAAIECYRRALQLRPEYPEAEANFAYALLMHGDFAEGWARHERRWDASHEAAKSRRRFGRPQWDGRTAEGATILLYAEQGFGDTIQFARYATLVAARRMTVVIECQPPLARLLRAMPGVSRVVTRGETLPDFDFACPLMSLPLAFGTTLQTIPDEMPYLRVDPRLIERWRQRFDGSPALRVGLAWRGEPRNKNDRKRSLPLAALAPLARIARCYSLQVGGVAESKAPGPGVPDLVDWTADIEDFADTAALISCLDLVVTVDTAVAHLAGALGKPVWMLCRFESEWRWLLEREDTPWYPSMRIFRQERDGDWSAPVARIAAQIAEVAAKKRPQVPAQRMLPAQQHYARGELAPAEEALRGMVAEWPAAADAWNNLGCVLQAAGKRAEAVRHYLRGLALNPLAADAHNNLGTALQESGDLEGAVLRYRRATELLPAYAQAWNNLGLALQRAGSLARARAAFASAAQTSAGRAEAHYNLGNLAREEANLAVAGDEFRRALEADPQHASAHWNHGLALLFQGRYREGWAEYEWRWRAPEFRHLRREFREPAWNGEDLAGRTILLWSEQGLGDTLQFVRYAALVAGRRGRVVLETKPELKRLLAATPGVVAVLAHGEALPAFDCQLPLLSLPRIFGTELETIPTDVPYVHAPHAEVRSWRERMPQDGGLRVGIAWAGARRHPADGRRSIDPERLAPLAAVESLHWFSLQKDADAARPALPPLPDIVDTHGMLGDMADTAALVEHLDLVIAVDSAVAHLAAAMGKPVWLLCRHESEWRWMLEREDSPWYPTMRIFRQETPDDWTGVMRRVAGELARVTSGADETRFDASAAARELFVANRLQEAESALRTAMSRRPAVAGLLSDLSVIVGARGRNASALTLCDRALAIDPALAAAHYNRGNALRELGRAAEAVPSYQRAIELRPDYFKAYNNLGLALKELDRLDEVRPYFDQALRLNPDFPDAHVNLGEVARLGARLEEAERLFRRALELRPDFAEAHWNLGSLLLQRGDFERGWPDYEWRWRLPELAGLQRGLDIPRWDGSDLKGRTLLLTAEQGLGDEIMFSSVIPEVAARARRCLVECSIKLAPLFARSFPGVTLLPVDRNREGWEKELATRVASISGIDVQYPLGSLPALFRRRLGDFPPHHGYLRADPGRIAAWRERLQALGPGVKLGLSWRGGTKATGLVRRSLDLMRLAPLVKDSGAAFVSLQYTNSARELAEFHRRTGLAVHHWQEAIDDYDETAALVCALDGVVSVCTAIVHLGGALGRPVWVMAPAVPEWRYGIAGEGMPWYPSVRVLRQRAEGDWGTVIAEVASRVAALRRRDGP